MLLQFLCPSTMYPLYTDSGNHLENAVKSWDGSIHAYTTQGYEYTLRKDHFSTYTSPFIDDHTYGRVSNTYSNAGKTGNSIITQLGTAINLDTLDKLTIGISGIINVNATTTGTIIRGDTNPIPNFSLKNIDEDDPYTFTVMHGGMSLGTCSIPYNVYCTIEIEYDFINDTVSMYLNNSLSNKVISAGISGLSGTIPLFIINYRHPIKNISSLYILDNNGDYPFNTRLGIWDTINLEPVSSTNNRWETTDDNVHESVRGLDYTTNAIRYNSHIYSNIYGYKCAVTYESINSNYTVIGLIAVTGCKVEGTDISDINTILTVDGIEVDTNKQTVAYNNPDNGILHIASAYLPTNTNTINNITMEFFQSEYV